MGELLTSVLQGSVLGTLLFNIYLKDMFRMIAHTKICNFADDRTPYSSCDNVKEAMRNVKYDCAILNLSRGGMQICITLYIFFNTVKEQTCTHSKLLDF